MMRVSLGFRIKRFVKMAQRGGSPVLEPLGDWLLGPHNQKRNRNQRQQPESFHLFSPPGLSHGVSTRIKEHHPQSLINTNRGALLERRPEHASFALGVRRRVSKLVVRCAGPRPVEWRQSCSPNLAFGSLS